MTSTNRHAPPSQLWTIQVDADTQHSQSTKCRSCRSPLSAEINARLLSGESPEKVSAWLGRLGIRFRLSHTALRRHQRDHLAAPPSTGPVETRTTGDLSRADLAKLTRDIAFAKVEAGELDPTLSEGLRAQEMLDRRAEKATDRDMMLTLAGLLSGATTPVSLTAGAVAGYLEDPALRTEREADIALFRELAEGSDVVLAPYDRKRLS